MKELKKEKKPYHVHCLIDHQTKNKHFATIFVTILTLGSRSKQGLAKVLAKSGAWESHFMLPGM
jgi:hypothetical protein